MNSRADFASPGPPASGELEYGGARDDAASNCQLEAVSLLPVPDVQRSCPASLTGPAASAEAAERRTILAGCEGAAATGEALSAAPLSSSPSAGAQCIDLEEVPDDVNNVATTPYADHASGHATGTVDDDDDSMSVVSDSDGAEEDDDDDVYVFEDDEEAGRTLRCSSGLDDVVYCGISQNGPVEKQAHLDELTSFVDAVHDNDWYFLYSKVVSRIPDAFKTFWLRYTVRRRTLKRLAEECAKFVDVVRQRAAQIRAAAARRRIDLLRAGDLDAYNAAFGQVKEKRLQDILDETQRIFAHIGADVGDKTDASQSLLPQPEMLKNVTMMPHQLRGLTWMVQLFDRGMNGILADDMGLGKTLQTIALLAYLLETCGEQGPHLIVVPLSTVSHWSDEIKSFAPDLHLSVITGTSGRGKYVHSDLLLAYSGGLTHVVVTTYETILNHHLGFVQIPWHTMVIDEGQKLKNYNSKFSQTVRSVPARHKLLLTGTPLQNSLQELWSLLAFVAPREFASLHDFEQWFALPPPPSLKFESLDGNTDRTPAKKSPSSEARKTEEATAETLSFLSEEEELLMIQRLHGVLRPFLLRRTKALVLRDLPKKIDVEIRVPLSAWQEALYRRGLRCIISVHRKRARRFGQASVWALRKAVNHPYHFEDMRNGRDDNLIRGSGKFEFLERVLPRLCAFKHKVLIFSQTATALNALEGLLGNINTKYERIDGRRSLLQRRQSILNFSTDDTTNVMMLTTRAGGLGLNLQAADTVIIFDSDFNPQVDIQAIHRAHRIGQTRPVLAIRLTTPTGLDNGVTERTRRKLEIERQVIGAGNFHSEHNSSQKVGDEREILRELVRESRSSSGTGVAGAKATPLIELNRLLARSDEEFAAFQKADEELFQGDSAKASEGVRDLLERHGRLIKASEVPSLPKAAEMGPRSRAKASKKKVIATVAPSKKRRRRMASV